METNKFETFETKAAKIQEELDKQKARLQENRGRMETNDFETQMAEIAEIQEKLERQKARYQEDIKRHAEIQRGFDQSKARIEPMKACLREIIGLNTKVAIASAINLAIGIAIVVFTYFVKHIAILPILALPIGVCFIVSSIPTLKRAINLRNESVTILNDVIRLEQIGKTLE